MTSYIAAKQYIGANWMWTWQLAEYNHTAEKHGSAQFVSMQTHYSVLYREEEGEMITYCLHKKIGSIPWARLAEGHLARPRGTQKTTRETTAQYKRTLKNSDQEIIDRVESRGKNHSVLKAQIAIVNDAQSF